LNTGRTTPLWWRLLWRLRSRRFRQRPSGPVILLYHSISDRTRDPLRLSTPVSLFGTHLEWLSRHRSVMSLPAFVAALRERRLPEDAVAITFDDGYADNASTAEPLLRQHSLHGTIFVAAAGPDSGREPWWEELDALILADDALHGTLELADRRYVIDEPYEAAREQAWNILEPAVTQRQQLFSTLGVLAAKLDPIRRQTMLDDLVRARGGRPSPRTSSTFASWEALASAASHGCLALGAHTRHHSCLAAQPPGIMREEIQGGVADHKARLGSGPCGFAYPFGTSSDFGPREQAELAATGLAWACANQPAHLGTGCGLFALPRLLVTRQNRHELALLLGGVP